MEGSRPDAVKWQRLARVQLVAAGLLGAFAALAFAGPVGVPHDGGLAPVLMAIVMLLLAVRSLRKAHEPLISSR